jgi:hypothetical protein
MRSVVSARTLAPNDTASAAARIAKRMTLIALNLSAGYTGFVPTGLTPARPAASVVPLKAATNFSNVGEKPPSDGTIASGGGSSAVR